MFSAPHQSVAGLLGSPCRVSGIGRSAAEYAAAAEMDEHQHIGCPWPTERKYGLGEEVAGDHAFHMRPDECGPRQGWLLFSPLWARVNARLSKDAFDGICTGIKPQFFQLARDPLVALKEVFRSDPGDDVAQLLRQARPSHRLEGGSTAHLGEPAFVGRRFGNFYEPVDLVPTLSPDAEQLGFFGGRQDDPFRRNARPQDRDLGLQQSQMRVVPRHEELVQEDQKEG